MSFPQMQLMFIDLTIVQVVYLDSNSICTKTYFSYLGKFEYGLVIR